MWNWAGLQRNGTVVVGGSGGRGEAGLRGRAVALGRSQHGGEAVLWVWGMAARALVSRLRSA